MFLQPVGASRVEQLKVRRKFDLKDLNRARVYLATCVQEARSKGDRVLEVNVGKICAEAGLEGATRHEVLCNVLDSESFARNHALWYHHRRGAWGTAAAEYTFVMDEDPSGATTGRPSTAPRGIPRTLLWVAVVGGSATVICVVFMLVSR